MNAPSDRIFAGKVTLREAAANYRDPGRFSRVLTGDVAASQQRHAHRLQRARVYLVVEGRGRSCRFFSSWEFEWTDAPRYLSREAAYRACRLDPRNRTNLLQKPLEEERTVRRNAPHISLDLLEVFGSVESHFGRQQAFGIEAGIAVAFFQIAAHHPAGSNQENHRQADFRNQHSRAAPA